MGQGAAEHSLANHLCRLSAAQNLNPLFNLQTRIQYANAVRTHSKLWVKLHTQHTSDFNAGNCQAHRSFRKRERPHVLCLQIYRKRWKPQPLPGVSDETAGPTDLQRCSHQHKAAGEHKTHLPGGLGSGQPCGSPARGKLGSLLVVSKAGMCPSPIQESLLDSICIIRETPFEIFCLAF